RFSRDWSSDVCSSDLDGDDNDHDHHGVAHADTDVAVVDNGQQAAAAAAALETQALLEAAMELEQHRDQLQSRLLSLQSELELAQIGRASCRESTKATR